MNGFCNIANFQNRELLRRDRYGVTLSIFKVNSWFIFNRNYHFQLYLTIKHISEHNSFNIFTLNEFFTILGFCH